MSTVHPIAQAGFDQGTNEAYDQYRPTFPVEQLDYIQSCLPRPKGPLNVLELGSGTGIFTRCLLAHESLGPEIACLKAVDPSQGMRARFAESVKDERVACSDGTFDRTGADDGWADLVAIAQAWHWCPDFDAALAEIARVLKAQGICALVWNLEDMETPWVARNRELYEKHEQGTPQFRLGLWRQMFNTPAFKRLYEPQDEHEITWIFPVTVEGAVNRVFTKSYIAVLPDAEKEALRHEIFENTSKGEGRKWIDQEQGVFEYPHKNLVVILRKK